MGTQAGDHFSRQTHISTTLPQWYPYQYNIYIDKNKCTGYSQNDYHSGKEYRYG